MNDDLARTIAHRVKITRQRLGYTLSDVAEKTGINKSTLQRYENGTIKNIPLDKLQGLSKALDLNPLWLIGLEVNPSLYKTKFKAIPILGNVIAGIPVDAQEDIIGYENISLNTAETGEFFALQIKGDSMLPKFSPGDVIIVRQQSTVENGEIAVVLVDNEKATVKKINYHDNEGISLVSFNSAYAPMYFTAEEVQSLPITILGKVVELRAKF